MDRVSEFVRIFGIVSEMTRRKKSVTTFMHKAIPESDIGHKLCISLKFFTKSTEYIMIESGGGKNIQIT